MIATQVEPVYTKHNGNKTLGPESFLRQLPSHEIKEMAAANEVMISCLNAIRFPEFEGVPDVVGSKRFMRPVVFGKQVSSALEVSQLGSSEPEFLISAVANSLINRDAKFLKAELKKPGF
jgi:hypothetical protein